MSSETLDEARRHDLLMQVKWAMSRPTRDADALGLLIAAERANERATVEQLNFGCGHVVTVTSLLYGEEDSRCPVCLVADAEREQRERAEKAETELERERVRLAGCGVAALGYCEKPVPEYADSVSLQDVLRLRERADGLERKLAGVREIVTQHKTAFAEALRGDMRLMNLLAADIEAARKEDGRE